MTNVFLAIQRELYEWHRTCATSERAHARRDKSALGREPMNYLFLSNRGRPHHESKDDRNALRDAADPPSPTALKGQLRHIADEMRPKCPSTPGGGGMSAKLQVEKYFAALERLKARGEPISNDAVALEAGSGRGNVKKSRPAYTELVAAMDAAAKQHTKEKTLL
ncbi:MAG: hypothetical protein ABW032_06665 [Burkholderiaceae bacterium]